MVRVCSIVGKPSSFGFVTIVLTRPLLTMLPRGRFSEAVCCGRRRCLNEDMALLSGVVRGVGNKVMGEEARWMSETSGDVLKSPLPNPSVVNLRHEFYSI